MDYIFATVSSSHTGTKLSTIGDKIPIDKVISSNNMTINTDYSISLKAGRTYEISADFWSGAEAT